MAWWLPMWLNYRWASSSENKSAHTNSSKDVEYRFSSIEDAQLDHAINHTTDKKFWGENGEICFTTRRYEYVAKCVLRMLQHATYDVKMYLNGEWVKLLEDKDVVAQLHRLTRENIKTEILCNKACPEEHCGCDVTVIDIEELSDDFELLSFIIVDERYIWAKSKDTTHDGICVWHHFRSEIVQNLKRIFKDLKTSDGLSI